MAWNGSRQIAAWGHGFEGGVAVDAGHVHRDGFDLGASFLTEGFVEVAQRLFGAPLGDPHDPAGVVVSDDRQVLMTTAVGDLVHPEMKQIVEPVVAQVLVHDPADDAVDALPRAAHQGRDRGLVRALGQPRHHVFEVAGVAGPRTSPGDFLGADPAMGALDPADITLQPHLADAGVEMTPTTTAGVIPGSGRVSARASQSASPVT